MIYKRPILCYTKILNNIKCTISSQQRLVPKLNVLPQIFLYYEL